MSHLDVQAQVDLLVIGFVKGFFLCMSACKHLLADPADCAHFLCSQSMCYFLSAKPILGVAHQLYDVGR